MKTFGIIHIFLFLILMIAYQCSSAQDFAVTVKGDTVYGSIKPLTYGLEKKIQITRADKKRTMLSMFEVKSFVFDGETFHPIKGPNGYAFMKLLKRGYLSLYAYQLDNQLTYDGLFLVKRDGSSLDVPNLTFRKAVKNYLADCETVHDKIDEGTYGKRQIHTIVDEYNACIQAKTVDHDKEIAKKAEQSKKINSWDVLEDKVKNQSDFEGKESALEMIGEIKHKIANAERIPNFLVEGLKAQLRDPEFKAELENALKELNQ